MANAARLKNNEVFRAAFKRLCELEGQKYGDPLERKFYAGLAAYEEVLSAKNGRKTIANRTRPMLKRKGVMSCLLKWALDKKPTDGFRILIDQGAPELTAEYLAVEFCDRFPADAVENARSKLKSAGVGAPAPYEAQIDDE